MKYVDDLIQEANGWRAAEHWMQRQASHELAEPRRDRAAAERRRGDSDCGE